MTAHSMRENAHSVTDFEAVERVPRRRAAERLVDIAYALTGGETLDLRHDGDRVTVAVPAEVLMIRRSMSSGGRVEVTIELRWVSQGPVDAASGE